MRPGEECHAEPFPMVNGPWRSLFKLRIQTSAARVEHPHSRKQTARCRYCSPKATRKNPSRGCPMLNFQGSLTFHKTSAYTAFKKRPPCPFTKAMAWALRKNASSGSKPCCSPLQKMDSFYIMEGDGMGPFERMHLSDQISSGL
jgi:hypothetical protein